MKKTKSAEANVGKVIIATAVASLLAYGCAPSKQVVAKQTLTEANKLTDAKAWEEAYAKYTSDAANAIAWDSSTYRNATICASKLTHDNEAVAWGYKYSSFGDAKKLEALNASLSRLGLEEQRKTLIMSDTTSFFSILGEQSVLEIRALRQFELKEEGLVETYGRLTNTKVKSKVFDTYMKLAQKKMTAKRMEADCKEILQIAPDNKSALYYLASTKYAKAEATYTKLMSDYNKNKTQAAYAYLTRDLKKVVSPMYKESRTYFERLRKNEPENKTYIKYLVYINDRLSNEKEVARLKKLL